jgi:hypothetical protein
MKNLILGIALVGLAVACKNNENNQVSDATAVEAPEGGCGGCPESMCDEAAKADCATSCESAAGCEASAEPKVCPMTGEVQN